METQKIMDFLVQLSQNNRLEWMREHKPLYQEAKTGFEEIIQLLIDRICEFDPSVRFLQPGELTFRLNRDTRFSKDKSPYLPAFRAHISAGGRAPIPAGYFLCITPGASILGGGLFASQFPQATAMVRQYLASHSEEFLEMVSAPAFADHFKVVGEKLKNVPKDYDKDHPAGEYLKHKAWAVEYPVPDQLWAKPDLFLTKAADIFEKMKPLNDYLNQALHNFEMPKRN